MDAESTERQRPAPMTGGNYSLQGGFWALFAVQTSGAPALTIVPAGSSQATISWSTAIGTNRVLQETLSLSSTNWVNSPSASTNPITVPATLPTKFYRLFKPSMLNKTPIHETTH